ncbi:hypothetical protein [Aquimarina agarilytica]|uniref:hypothetical protein n=1 Tax=Aquimarina agarilytica TaxID=1087449 RepID=UPI0002898873|nr:hypothetical protein [Aquimarina agarilytica]
MQEEKDFIKREIQKLALVFKKLTSLIIKIEPKNIENELTTIESNLKKTINLTLKEISEMSEAEFIEKIKIFDEQNLEQLLELIHAIIIKSQKKTKLNLAKKGIVIADYLDKNSKTFSLKRHDLKNALTHYIQKNFS